MPLDTSLNNNAQICIPLHCAIIAHLSDDDSRKFLMETPGTIVKGIRRIWGAERNVPNSEQICHNCDKTLTTIGVVYRSRERQFQS